MPVSSVGSGSFHDGPVQLLIEVPAASARPQAKPSISGQAEKAMVASSPPHDTLSGGHAARGPITAHHLLRPFTRLIQPSAAAPLNSAGPQRGRSADGRCSCAALHSEGLTGESLAALEGPFGRLWDGPPCVQQGLGEALGEQSRENLSRSPTISARSL